MGFCFFSLVVFFRCSPANSFIGRLSKCKGNLWTVNWRVLYRPVWRWWTWLKWNFKIINEGYRLYSLKQLVACLSNFPVGLNFSCSFLLQNSLWNWIWMAFKLVLHQWLARWYCYTDSLELTLRNIGNQTQPSHGEAQNDRWLQQWLLPIRTSARWGWHG